MPAKTNGATATKTVAGKPFELPALEFKFPSLTEGTNIPPPPPSPEREKSPAAAGESKKKTAAAKGKRVVAAAGEERTNGAAASGSAPPNATTATTTTSVPGGIKRPADDSPVSPTFSTRQGSIRRLFSKTLLNSAYADGEETADGGGGAADIKRPQSRTSSFLDSKKAKRSSGWFSRLRHNDGAGGKRASMVSPTPDDRRPAGPPPPMIPEFSELKTSLDVQNEGSLGGDLFKDIK